MSEVAKTILEQLGGNRFLALTGSHSLVGGNNFLQMKLRRNATRANSLKITLNSMDTYDVVFATVSVRGWKVLKEIKGVYCDQLMDIFEEVTGLYVTLTARA